jgi:hypothetical protein
MAQSPGFQGMMQPFQGLSPQQRISQVAAMQEQQMMLERQRQALIMQQNAAVAQSTSRSSGKSTPATSQEAPEMASGNEEIVAPLPPTSKIMLSNHQTPILQPSPPRVSQVAQPISPPTTKKSR